MNWLSDATLFTHSLTCGVPQGERGPPMEIEVQTSKVEQVDFSCDPVERRSEAVQTEGAQVVAAEDANAVRISDHVVAMVLSTLAANARERRLLDRLNVLHETSSVHISLLRSFLLQPPPSLPVVGLASGPGDRCAVLVGEPFHDSWCSHDCSLRVVIRNKSSTLVLPNCPTSAVWLNRDIVAVGTVAGDVHLAAGEDLLSSAKFFSSPVSALHSPSPGRLLSASADGRLLLSALKGTELNVLKEIDIHVSDLPRTIRSGGKAATTTSRIGIVAVHGNEEKLLIASETGGLWESALSSLSTLHSLPSPPQAIAAALFHPPFLAIQTEAGAVQIQSESGELLDTMPLPTVRMVITPDDILITLSNTSTLSFYDLSKRKLLTTITRSEQIIDIVASGRDTLLAYTADNQLLQFSVDRV